MVNLPQIFNRLIKYFHLFRRLVNRLLRRVNPFHLFRRLVIYFLLEDNDGQIGCWKLKVVSGIQERIKEVNFLILFLFFNKGLPFFKRRSHVYRRDGHHPIFGDAHLIR